MLLPSFFIVEAEEFDTLSIAALPENAHIVFRVAARDLAESTIYKSLFRSDKKFPFCLLIDIDSVPGKESGDLQKHFDTLVAFTFHYKYIKTGYGNPLIIVQPKAEDDGNGYISLMRDALYSQGYDNMEPLIVKEAAIISWPQMKEKGVLLPLPVVTDTIIPEYTAILKKAEALSSYFFKVSFPKKLEAVLAAIQKTEEAFLQQFPQQYQLLKELNKLAAQNQQLLIEQGLLDEKLESQARYNSFFQQADKRYKKQILDIVDFYKKEYEILPLWFKQLGHIIKVITGKRTFKSLFNDNVKKYKD